MSNCDKAKLKSDIQNYWTRDLGRRYYIENILPREIICAQTDDIQRLPAMRCHQLVFLVGHSLEPLFQSIWAYKPKRILLILSQDYGEKLGSGDTLGEDIADEVNDVLIKIPEANLKPIEIAWHVIEGEQKDATQLVFRKLLDEIKENISPATVERTYPVVIDITGAKKSMVAGAFLFAAFTGVPVSYVDFDDDQYDRRRGKPYGYACRIGEVANPYQSFSLREWERVRTLYHQYNFRGAKEILEERIEPAMQEYLPDHLAKVTQLKRILDCYEQWDNGDFSGAWETTQEITKQLQGFTPPTAVEVLGKDGYWPRGDEAHSLLTKLSEIEFGKTIVTETIYLRPRLLLTYAQDELSRANRLINYKRDYRSALLKAVSLWEVLSRARVIGLWHINKLEVGTESKGKYFTKDKAPDSIKEWQKEIYFGLICTLSGGYVEAALKYDLSGNNRARNKSLRFTCYRDNQGNSVRDCKGQIQRTFFARRTSEAPLLTDDVSMGIKQDLRNKATHTYLSVDRSITEDACNTTTDNLCDYKDIWLPVIFESFQMPEVTAKSLPWSQLCELCTLSEFLTPNLRRDPHRKELS